LTNAATVGDTITTISFYVSSVLNAIPATAASINQSYLASGVAGTGPAFSAYLLAQQNLTSATLTKVTINTKTFDTASAFDNTTNYRFQPNIAGYYQITGAVNFNSTANNPTTAYGAIVKNGSIVKQTYGANSTAAYTAITAGLIYLNGSTDYVELYAYASGGSGTLYVAASGSTFTYFDGSLVRSA
jgi:hypothetical protein